MPDAVELYLLEGKGPPRKGTKMCQCEDRPCCGCGDDFGFQPEADDFGWDWED
jgi:hypothetical protein